MRSIIDVSSVIYGGHNGSDRRIRGFPVGGIRKLFGIINARLSCSDFALCFDGGEIIKKELLPTYKAGRIPDYSVMAQIDLLKELLTSCDIPFYWDAKYEADDFVFSICRELMLLGDPEETVIYTDDRDLACCITDNVSIHNVTTNGMCIDMNSYQDRVVRGRDIPYNTVLLWKVFHGDASDSYKALHIPGLTFEIFAQKFLDEVTPLISPQGLSPMAYAEYNVFEAIAAEFSSSISSDDLKRLLAQGRIAFPYVVPVSNVDFAGYGEGLRSGMLLYALVRKHMKVFGNGTFNRRRFDFYCSLLGLNQTKPSRSVDKDSPEAQEFYSLLELRAKELASGAMAVERYRNKRIVPQRDDTLPNMELPL